MSPRIRVFQDGDRYKDGCVYYRTYLPAQALINQGADIILDRKTQGVLWQDDVRISREDFKVYQDPRVKGWQDPDCDIAVFQRPLHRDVADLIEWCSGHGIKTVIDMDDDFYKIPRENKAWKHVQPDESPIRNTDHLERAIAACDLVTVTTPALARRYGRKSVVLPNYVPASVLDLPGRPYPTQVAVGWTGTLHTHPHDLESTRGGIARALEDTGARMHVVGDGEGVREALGICEDTELSITGWVPLEHYMAKMSEIDVGVVPLHTSAFNQGKSWLKGLEFASLGIPFVVSNTQAYVELNKLHGLGAIARNPREWHDRLVHLAVNQNAAEDIGEAGREVVRTELTIEKHAERWLTAWESALDRSSALVS